MLRWDICDYSDAYIVDKGKISVSGTNTANREIKSLGIMLHWDHAYQKSITHL